jgi:hypothetical protein
VPFDRLRALSRFDKLKASTPRGKRSASKRLAVVQVRGEPSKTTAQTEPQNPSQAKRERKKEPEWRNLTLDELKSWLEAAKREQAGAEIADESPR